MKDGHLGVGEERVRPTITFPERVRPPDTTQHLVAYTELVLARRAKVESRVTIGDLE